MRAVAGAGAVESDRRLLALATELHAVQAMIDANCAASLNNAAGGGRGRRLNAELDALQVERFWPIADEIAETPARTPEGIQAKARVLRIVFGSVDDPTDMTNQITRHTMGLVRDIVGDGLIADVSELASDGEPLASIHDYATLEFVDEGPGMKEAMGTPAEWMEQAKHDHDLMLFAAAMRQKNPAAMQDMVAQVGQDAMEAAQQGFVEARDRHRAYADGYDMAAIRTLAGVCRHVLAISKLTAV